MKKDNYILKAINEIKEILEKNDYRKKRYNQDVEWFEEREKQIESNIIRVAIMGITSSGKSTLVNALLGEKILPIAIIPSSSIITTVSKGEKRQATIYFKDKKPEVLEGDNLSENIIAKYADESRNPNNKFKVTQIDIKSPSFLLDDNIHIIDSPGLDACDLEMHEKLTLEILLPTIDICVFLTTIKANSDEINAEKIKIVNEKEKQIVLVQNMIDSVEEKLGRNGIVEEDKVTILKKHKKRAQNLLKSVDNNKEKFEVIQISALNALKGITKQNEELYKNSNIEEFIKSIERSISNVMPKINAQREISLSERIDQIINTDKEIIEGCNLENINFIKDTGSDIDDLVYDFKVSRDKISSKIKVIDRVICDTIDEINSSSSEEIESYLNIVEKINNKNIKIENQILDIVRECEDRKKEVYKRLNLDIRFNYSLPSIDNKNIDVKHKYEERTRLIKKDGFLNVGKRILSDIFETNWGYKQEEYDEKVVDKDATIVMVQNVCNQNRRKYMNILWDWSAQYNNSLNLFYNEITRKEEEYQKKKEQNIESYDIDEVINNLKSTKYKLKRSKVDNCNEIAVTLHENSEENKKNNIEESKTTMIKDHSIKDCVIPNVAYNLYKLSNEILEKNYLVVGNYIREKSINQIKKETHQIFWTWDVESCVKFVSRVCGIYLNESIYQIIKKEGIYTFDNVIIIYELCEDKSKLCTSLKDVNKNFYNMYIMFNGIQIGNSEKQIIESINLKHVILNNEIMINLVIDSSKEFINANNIKELLLSVSSLERKIISRFNNQDCGYILINSKNPIYNMALIEGQENDRFLISEYRDVKSRLFENVLSRGKEERQTLEEILSYFLK